MNAAGDADKAVTARKERLRGSRAGCKESGVASVVGWNQVKMEENTGVLGFYC